MLAFGRRHGTTCQCCCSGGVSSVALALAYCQTAHRHRLHQWTERMRNSQLQEAQAVQRRQRLLWIIWVCCTLSRVAPVRFGYGLGMERFERFRFSVPAVPLTGGVFVCFSTVQFNREDGSGSAFDSWKNGSDGSAFRFRFGSWAT